MEKKMETTITLGLYWGYFGVITGLYRNIESVATKLV